MLFWPVSFLYRVVDACNNCIASIIKFVKTTFQVGFVISLFCTFFGILLLIMLSSAALSITQDATGYFFGHLTVAVYSLLSKLFWISCAAAAIYAVKKL